MHNYIESLNWRYATKKFDSAKKVSQENINIIKEATQLSVSSYGLQPYEIYEISNPKVREELKAASYNQSQITDASHLFVFAHKTGFGEELVDDYIENISKTREIPVEGLADFSNYMKNNVVGLPDETKHQWTARQAYIALGNLISAAAHLHIDACPMEGFEPEKYNKILGLTEKGLNAVLVVAVGYRSEDDDTQHYKKVRKPQEQLFTLI